MTSRCHSRSNRWMCVAASFGWDNPSIPSSHVTAIRMRCHGCSGEAAALTVLLGSSLKFQGRFQLQTKTDGPIEMIVVDFDAPDRLRATARFDQDRLNAMLANAPGPAS